MSLARLATRTRALARRVERGVEGFVAEIGTEIARELVPATPVKTGFARANWRPSLNAPAQTTLSALDPTGAATIARIQTTARRFRLGGALFIVNRTPYIGQLNAGSSPQAPSGFIQAAVRRGARQAGARARLLSVSVRSV